MLKSGNDSEVESILSENSEKSSSISDKPLSPILISSNLNRKFLFGKRSIHKKSRRKLSDKFEEANPKQTISNGEKISSELQEFTEDSFTLSQSENLMTCLNRLEEIERNRDHVYKLLVSSKNNDFFFKKPISPAPNKSKKMKTHAGTSSDPTKCNPAEIEILSDYIAPVPNEIPKLSGFQTATGKHLSIPEQLLEKHQKLFDDILTPSQKVDEARKNKYNFLSKASRGSSFNSNGGQNLVMPCTNNKNFTSTESCMDVKINTSSPDRTGCVCESSISLTQEINNFEVSNSSLLYAVDDILSGIQDGIPNIDSSNPHEEFMGFNREEIFKSISIHNKISKIHKNFTRLHESSSVRNRESISSVSPFLEQQCRKNNKHLLDNSDLPPKKRIKQDGFVTTVFKQQKTELEKDTPSGVSNLPCMNSVGFLSASGKSILTDSLKKAKNISDEIEAEIIKDNKLKSYEENKGTRHVTGLKNSINDLGSGVNVECSPATAPPIFPMSLGGFSSASGKSIAISANSLKKAKNIFDEVESEIMISDHQNQKNCDIEISKKNEYSTAAALPNLPSMGSGGFSSASGKSIPVSTNSSKRANSIFDETDLDINEGKKAKYEGNQFMNNLSGFNTGSVGIEKNILKETNNSFPFITKGNSISKSNQFDGTLRSGSNTKSRTLLTVKDKLKFFDAMIENDELSSSSTNISTNFGFSSASGNALRISERSLNFGQNVFADIENSPSLLNSKQAVGPPKLTTQADAKNKLKFLDEVIKMAESKCDDKAVDLDFSHTSGKNIRSSAVSFVSAAKKSLSISDAAINASNSNKMNYHSTPTRANIDTTGPLKSKRKLGVTSCKQIPISETKLNRAKQLFREEFMNMSPIRSEQQSFPQTSTPLRPVQQTIVQTSTPLRKDICTTPVRNNMSVHSRSSADINGVFDIQVAVEGKEGELLLSDDLLVTFDELRMENCSNLEGDLDEEWRRLEKRLKIIKERREAVLNMKEKRTDVDKKPCPGVLYLAKTSEDRIPLISLVGGRKPGETSTSDLFSISPQNAEKIHFKESASKVSTKDCAIVVPNSKDLIGLLEIDYAFRAMPGVEARLIPKGWIRNHYKWIIWKLASYERMFPLHLSQSLSVENVIQQLKYRYDREIDKAERPALRKIYEKDDAPQKRMILCVSDIKKVDSNRFELELTDGWYGIRAVLDDPLCTQIHKKRIRIGTKLVTCGAELMNCDGCSPLEATDLTYLKISFNCTRRAIWNARLGYQKFPGPFPIQIHSVHPLGGPIGAIQISIARVYPMKYLEKLENQSVWRNKRAEERRAQEWELERCRKMEQIQKDLRKEYSGGFERSSNLNKKSGVGTDISEINCPELLSSMIENSNDPDSIQEKLSSSQRSAVIEYRRRLFQQKQEEMSSKIKQSAEKLKMLRRDVIPVLKMLVVDINGSPTRAFTFTIWRPTESHFQILKEGTSVTAYNVLPKMNGDLSCSSKTTFKLEPPIETMSEIFRRKVIGIAELSELKFSVNFSEFDTVGLVVQIKIDEKLQEVWLADLSGRLLLIQIYESPTMCLLLDNLKRGQAITVCNLGFRNLTDGVSRAIGNHFTVFSSYSQHKHLQEYLDDFKKRLPKSCDKLLEDCDNKIELFWCKASISSANLDESDEDTLMSSRLTSTDLALSLIDMDKFT